MTSHGTSAAQPDDGQLIERCQQGDRASFDALVQRHYALAYNVACRMLGDQDYAADATQAAFVRAYKAISRFRRDATFSTWLYRITTNVCLDHLRQHERRTQSLTLLGDDADTSLEEMDIPDDTGDPGLDIERGERQQTVREAICRLPPTHRSVLVLYDLQGCSYEQIAEVLGIPLGTVKSRLNRARHALKDELASHMELFS